MADAGAAVAPPAEAVQTVRIVGSKVFVSNEGVWTDTAFDPGKMETVKVAFLSDDYFALAASRPALAAAFALGIRVIALSDGVAYEVVQSGTPVEPLELPPTLTAPLESTKVPAPTEKPGIATPEPGLVAPTPPTAPGTMPCASGLLPLGFVPLAAFWLRRRK